MEKFSALRQSCATSRKREDFATVYSEMSCSASFNNAWESAAENSTYDSFGESASVELEEDEDNIFEFDSIENSAYEDMTFNPQKVDDDEHYEPMQNYEQVQLQPGPPLYLSLMRRLSSSTRTGSQKRSSNSPLASPDVKISLRDKKVQNPLFVPSPKGSPRCSPASSPCGSPLANNPIRQRMLNEELYDTPLNLKKNRNGSAPALPPKLRPNSGVIRGGSLDNRRTTQKKNDRKRTTSLGDRENSVSLTNIEVPILHVPSRRGKTFGNTRSVSESHQDTGDDWNEIENMLDGLQCEITVAKNTLSTLKSGQKSSLETWLVGLDLSELQVMMEVNGWDNLAHIGGVMAKEDIVAMGINNDKIKRKLLKAAEEDLPRFNHVTVPETVEEWLNDIDLSRYLPRFNTNRMASVSRVLEIWEIELTSILHIEPIGYRKRIMKSIRELRLMQSTIDEAHKKDTLSKKKMPKWFHDKEEMLRGVDYAVRYFGCVKLDGPECPKLTAQLCAKQQKKFSDNQKVPEFRLRISASGIEFIDRDTQQISTKYPIEDISFVSRDKTDLLVFSFISTDRKIGIKMCHIFKAASRNQAFETCSTIAQSFEVAFQLREEGKKTGS